MWAKVDGWTKAGVQGQRGSSRRVVLPDGVEYRPADTAKTLSR
jgi:hypothetical protein